MILFVNTPMGADANSQYRCVGPWSDLQHEVSLDPKGRDFSFEVGQDDMGHRGISWNHIRKFDAVFLHRPCSQDQTIQLEIAKNMNKPVMIDFDDDLFQVPRWNPHFQVYDNIALQSHIAITAACADVIGVSTEPLYHKFKKVNKNVVIFPNSYSTDLYWYREKTPPKRQPLFAWRGTNTHDADLLSVREAFKQLPAKTLFYGGPTWQLLNDMPPDSFHVMGAQDPFNYMRQLYHDAPKVMLVPLVDCFFNRCKSNIAYQEALHAGALCVAPDLPEWQRRGVINYKAGDAASFLAAANEAFNMPEDEQAEIVASAFEQMKSSCDSKVINATRYSVLKEMVSPDFERNRQHPRDEKLKMLALAALKNNG